MPCTSIAVSLLLGIVPGPGNTVDPGPRAAAAVAQDAVEGLTVGELPGELTEDDPIGLHPFSFDAAGELHVWTESAGVPIQLRLLDETGRVLASTTDGGGRGRPYLGGPMATGREFTVEVSCPGRTLPCPYTLHSRTWRESEASLAAARELQESTDGVRGLATGGDLEGARKLARTVVERVLESEALPPPALRNALWGLGGLVYQLGDNELPILVGRRLLETHLRCLPEGHPSIVSIRFNLGISLTASTRSAEAGQQFESVVATLEAEGDLSDPTLHSAQLYALQSKRSTGATREAIAGLAALEERLLVHAPGRLEFMASVRTERAVAHAEEGELEMALRLLESTMATLDVQEFSNPNIEIGLREALGLVRSQQGDLGGARPQLAYVVDHLGAQLAPDHPRLIDAINNLAALELLLGHVESAHRTLEPIVEVVRANPALPERVRWTVLLNWCSTLVFLGRAEEALELHQSVEAELTAEGSTGRLIGSTRLNGARILAECQRFEEALELTRELYRDPLDLPLNQRRMEITRESLRFQLEIVAGSRSEAFESLLAITEWVEQHLVEAVLSGSTTLAASAAYSVAESRALAIGGALTLSDHPGSPALLQRLLALENFARSAAARARSLARRAERKFSTSELEELRRNWDLANSELAELLSKTEAGTSADGELLEIADRRARAEESLRNALVIEDEAIDPGALDLFGALDSDDAALVFAVSAEPREFGSDITSIHNLTCFVVTPGPTVRLVDLGSLPDLRTSIDAWRATLVGAGDAARGVPPRTPGRESAAAQELRLGLEVTRRLIEPLGLDLESTDRLLLIPLGDLHRIPFGALPIPGESKAAAPLRLGDLVRPQWVESIDTDLGELATENAGTKRTIPLLAFGGIDYGDTEDSIRAEPFAPLPGTERELAALGELFEIDEDSPHLLRGLDATRGAFLEEAPRARHLHVATHGWYDPLDRQHAETRASRPPFLGEQIQLIAPYLTTGLAFAEANTLVDATGPDSGVVLAEDLAHLDLSQCELAVLSACETSLGPVVRGNGLRSLQSALHGAGVGQAVTSIWPVSDQSTALLMESFYRATIEESLTPIDALAQAKREVRGRHPHPHHWAGWVLSGFATPKAP